MVKLQLQASYSILGKIDYRFYTQEGDLLYTGSLDPITTGVNSITRDISILPFSLSLDSPCGEKFFSIHSKRGTLLSPLSYSIIYHGGRVPIVEGHRFEIPNLIIKYPGQDIALVGQVRDLAFSLKAGDDILADIQGQRCEDGKNYSISIYDESIPQPIYLGSSLILDNLYQDY